MPWHGHDFAPLFGRQRGGDQAARLCCPFDNHDAQRHARNDAVALWKVVRPWRKAEGLFRQQHAPLPDLFGQLSVVGRVDLIDPARHDGNGSRGKRCLMGRGVNTACQPGNDRQPLFAQPACKGTGHAQAQA